MKVKKYLEKNIDSINLAFKTKYKFIEKNTTQNNLIIFKMLQKIYSSWSGLKLKSHEKDRNNVTKTYITEADNVIDYLSQFKFEQTAIDLMLEDE